MHEVGAVILAAGESSRFGRPKLLVQFRGRTMIERTVAIATRAHCQPIVVVTGSDSAKIAGTIHDESIVIEENLRWRHGLGGSIRAGVERLITIAPDTEAIVILVCDQPFVSEMIVNQLIDQWRLTGKPIVGSSYADTVGVPTLFDRSCFGELQEIGDEQGAKAIILRNPERVANIVFPEGKIDIDTPADAAMICEISEPM